LRPSGEDWGVADDLFELARSILNRLEETENDMCLLMERNEHLHDDICDLALETNEQKASARIADLSNQISLLTEENRRLVRDREPIEDKDLLIVDLNTRLTQITQYNEVLSGELRLQFREVVRRDQSIQELQLRLEEKENARHSLEVEVEALHELAENRAKLWRSRIDELESEVEDLIDASEELTNENDQITANGEKIAAELESLNERLVAYRASSEKNEELANNLQVQIDEIVDNLKIRTAKHGEVTALIGDITGERNVAFKLIEFLDETIEMTEEALKDMTEELERSSAEAQEMFAELYEAKQAVEGRVNALTESLESAQKVINVLHRQPETQNGLLADSERDRQPKADQLLTLEEILARQLDEAREEIARITEHAVETDENIIYLQADIEHLRLRIRENDLELAIRAGRIEQLSAQLDDHAPGGKDSS
jgi:chromosome segregation ATPase